jgi:membrane protease YdiL (CAAX protease family)
MNLNTSPQPTKRWRWWVHLVLIGSYPIIGVLLVAVHHPARRTALTNNVTGLLFVSGVEIALFSIIFCLGWHFSRASAAELFLHWRSGWAVVPLGIGYSIAIRVAVAVAFMIVAVVLLITQTFSIEELREFFSAGRPDVKLIVDVSALRENVAYRWLTITLVSFVVAGLREEVWRAGTLAAMRRLWPNVFGDQAGQIAAVALLAMVFGLAHLPLGLLAAAAATILGFLLGVIIVVHASIWPAVIAHGLFDATTFAFLTRASQYFH